MLWLFLWCIIALRDLMGKRERVDHSGFKNPRVHSSKCHHQTSPDYHLNFKTYHGWREQDSLQHSVASGKKNWVRGGGGRQCMEWPQGKSFSHPIHPDGLTNVRRSKKSRRKDPINYLFLRLKSRTLGLQTNPYRLLFFLSVGRFLLRGRGGWQIWRIGVAWGQRNCQSWSTVIPHSFVKTPLNLLKAKASTSFPLYLQGLAQITPNSQSVLC